VLQELRVENLLLIERAELRLAPGLNVLTGETGAGKTVLAHALDLLLGGKARPGIVRPGAKEAYVEGVFDLPDDLRARLGDRLAPDADELVLARRVTAEGRTRAYLGGRSATAADLQEAGGALLAFYGQHEHRRLTLASAQLDIVDGFCGPDQARRREHAAAAHARVRAILGELEELRERAGARDRELDLLVWELEEIEAAAPDPGEERELLAARDRLRHVEVLRAAAWTGGEALAPEGGEGGAAAAMADAERLFDGAAGVDPALDGLAERFRALRLEAEDLGAELRRYEEGLDAEPGRLEEAEARLDVLDRLKRKHGGTIEAVLAHADRCRERRTELEGAEVAIEDATARLDAAREELAAVAAELRAARERAAGPLAEAVQARLADLAMEGASFEVRLGQRPEPGPAGADAVELVIAPNPGVPPAPLRDIASGGEVSRIMLALLTAANDGRDATLVFDEIDAGIGGQTARAVGEQLRALGEDRQVICITHLPQVAAYAGAHFRIAKHSDEETALTTVTRLDDGSVVGELVRMLGAPDGDSAARRHAEELLAAA
jgi:DNA repair protein RecN (Recombination protein N)